MSLIGAELGQIWNVLRASGPQRQHRLDEVRVREPLNKCLGRD